MDTDTSINGPAAARALNVSRGKPSSSAHHLVEMANAPLEEVYTQLRSGPSGLSMATARERLLAAGPNSLAKSQAPSLPREIWDKARNPINGLLLGLALVSWLLSDIRSAVVITVMVILSVVLSFIQEHRSNAAAAKLANMVRVSAAVKRAGAQAANADGFAELPLDQVVPGDIVSLSAGDLVPADLRLVSAQDLYVNQSALTGESLPAEKGTASLAEQGDDPFACRNLCFMGSSVASGYATGIVFQTGRSTFFGQLAEQISSPANETSFDRGIRSFAWLMLRFILVMMPLVFVINGLTKHDWLGALFFAVAIAVGLAPEMLPMIVTVNLAQGAMAMARKNAIVKRLNAIQNLGAMDVLCSDKTGTLTQDRVVLKRHLDVNGNDDGKVLAFAYLNSRFQTGLKNLLDVAIQQHAELEEHLSIGARYRKLGEIPFDFARRRLSVIVGTPADGILLVCKGAVEEMLSLCSTARTGDAMQPLDQAQLARTLDLTARLNADGFRVIAIATKILAPEQLAYGIADESGLTLQGFIAFLDPPKDSAAGALAALARSGIAIKILTGDNQIVTQKTCSDVGLAVQRVIIGWEIEELDDSALQSAVETANVFAKVSPSQKARIISALQAGGHVVGFLGDGINDGPALKRADVGLSIDTAVDIAKESADIILLEKNLTILNDGVLEGRRVFGNIVKYIKMGASSNFGNMLSVLGASLFLPFLPMAPLQVLTNNLLYDFSQTTIPTDGVDPEYLELPRKWEIGKIMHFMFLIGPVSSLFDAATFTAMLLIFDAWENPALFQTGWFVESVLTQTLIIHVIRTSKLPFLQSWASGPLIASTAVICAVAVYLPYSPLSGYLGFVPLPGLYWPVIGSFLAGYVVLTTIIKTWFLKRWGV